MKEMKEMKEEYNELYESLTNLLSEENNVFQNLELYFLQLFSLYEKLNKLREEIKEDKLENFTDDQIKEFRDKLRKLYKKQDLLIENSEDLTLEEKEFIYKDKNYIKILSIKLDNQILIGRMVNKVQKEEAARINNKNEELKKSFIKTNSKMEKTYQEIVEENSSMKESVLTVSSLIFTAFTLIQINFVAFQNSKDYFVLDRIILFSGINVFLILGVYCILSMIKSFFNIKTFKEKEADLSGKIIIVSFVIFAIFTTSLFLKRKTEDYEKQNNITIKKLEKENNELKEKIESYEKEVDNKLNNLELQIINYKKEQSLLEDDFLEYKENMNKKK